MLMILIAVLAAMIIILILVMLTSVYQMDRDYKSRYTKLSQNYLSLEHKIKALEAIVNRMREVERNDDE